MQLVDTTTTTSKTVDDDDGDRGRDERSRLLLLRRERSEKALRTSLNRLKDIRLVGEHQHEGCEWMLRKEFDTERVRGGVLADDVGLGKTYMMAAVLKANRKPRTLVVTLVSVVMQWLKIMRSFAGLDSTTIPNHYPSVPSCCPDIVITTYSKIRMRPQWAMNTHWDRIVLDEGHVIRNPKTSAYKALNDIKGDVRWVLSATPIHNSARDMLALFTWIGIPQSRFANLKDLTAEYMIRRTQNSEKTRTRQLALLPVDDKVVSIEWTHEYEKTLYDALEAKMSGVVASVKNEFVRRNVAIEAIVRLRQICVSFVVYQHSIQSRFKVGCEEDSSGSDEDEGEYEYEKVEEQQGEVGRTEQEAMAEAEADGRESSASQLLSSRGRLEDDMRIISEVGRAHPVPPTSSKMKYLCDAICANLRRSPKDKIIVFSSFISEMDIVARELTVRRVPSARLHGGMSNDKRNAQVEQFSSPRSGTNVLVAQIMCSSTGMNLQCANVVYITSPTWNPCIEKQAIGRVHRQGQKKPVVIRRLVMKDSVEMRCLQRQSLKLSVIKENLGSEDDDDDEAGSEGEGEGEGEGSGITKKYVDDILSAL